MPLYLRRRPVASVPMRTGRGPTLIVVQFVRLTSGAVSGREYIARARSVLDPEELRQAASFRARERAVRYMLGHACARVLLARSVSADPASLSFDRRCRLCGHPSHGKPRLREARDLAFSLSYAGAWMALAVSSGEELGVDIELVESARDAAELAGSVLTGAERAAWLQCPAAERPLELMRRWTMKEAYLKCIGAGLGAPAADVDTVALSAAGLVEQVRPPDGCISALATECPGTGRHVVFCHDSEELILWGRTSGLLSP